MRMVKVEHMHHYTAIRGFSATEGTEEKSNTPLCSLWQEKSS